MRRPGGQQGGPRQPPQAERAVTCVMCTRVYAYRHVWLVGGLLLTYMFTRSHDHITMYIYTCMHRYMIETERERDVAYD